ncbi:DUF2508 family protein [Pelotomaculum isophthalicicum JI]|uniref:DUF2508 family protein n=1 Tax=Pelotomaculum isophthalicicum JI TaxID=947010 RepID=A0A9X4GXN7_9FIRM|nr:DUF2508 family protein [Pelotomaculum isophthalicicum]MDF9406995.1 DUF2508 family protein [Pelotomaculum isophthalicicum JI]
MNIKSVVKLLSGRIAGLTGMRVDGSHASKLALAVDGARRDWQQALQEFNYAEGDLVDSAILKINTAEKHYMTLLNQAKKEGAVAWPIKPGTHAPINSNTHP